MSKIGYQRIEKREAQKSHNKWSVYILPFEIFVLYRIYCMIDSRTNEKEEKDKQNRDL